MDIITHLYISKMRLYRDRPDVLVPGRWFWCPEGAVDIPYFHRFLSYTGDTWDRELYVAEVGEEHHWYGRNLKTPNPRFTGQHFCGTQEDWEQGPLYSQRGTRPVDEEGVPLCCEAEPLRPGGALAEGNALVVYAFAAAYEVSTPDAVTAWSATWPALLGSATEVSTPDAVTAWAGTWYALVGDVAEVSSPDAVTAYDAGGESTRGGFLNSGVSTIDVFVSESTRGGFLNSGVSTIDVFVSESTRGGFLNSGVSTIDVFTTVVAVGKFSSGGSTTIDVFTTVVAVGKFSSGGSTTIDVF